MTDDILSIRELEIHIASFKLIPSAGGVFEFAVNGELLYSKKQTKRHAEDGEILGLLQQKITELQHA